MTGAGDPTAAGPEMRLLVIDDNATYLTLMVRILQRAGFSSVTATQDPRQAGSLFDEIRPELVFVDLHMPHLDGFAVAEQLRDRHPDLQTSIVLMTGDSPGAAEARARRVGIAAVLGKPFNTTDVVTCIGRILAGR